MNAHIYLFSSICFATLGQILLKWRIRDVIILPSGFVEKFTFLFLLIFDPLIFLSLLADGLAYLAWMAALTKLELNYAFMMSSLIFVFVIIFSRLLLNEPISVQKIVGMLLIILGVVIIARG